MSFGGLPGKKSGAKEYLKVKESYIRYIEFYKLINKGSLKGASTFDEFYLYKTFETKYKDPHRILADSFG